MRSRYAAASVCALSSPEAMRAPSCATVASSSAKGFRTAPTDAAGTLSDAKAPAAAPRKPRRESSGSSSCVRLGIGLLPHRGMRGVGETAEVYVDQRLGVALEREALRREHPGRDHPRHERERAHGGGARIHARRELAARHAGPETLLDGGMA